MLKEKPRHDSGNGIPHWVVNQSRDFLAEPRSMLFFRWGKLNYYRSVFHHLNDRLEYEEQLSKQFHKFSHKKSNMSWIWRMREYMKHLKAIMNEFHYCCEVNTTICNIVLDQDIQYEHFRLNGDAFVLLQVHNGSNLNHGFSIPNVFSIQDESFFLFSDGFIQCNSCDAYWMSPDGNHWYFEGTHGIIHKKVQLEDLLDIDCINQGEKVICPICNNGQLDG